MVVQSYGCMVVWSYGQMVVHPNFFGLMGYYYFVSLWGYTLRAPLLFIISLINDICANKCLFKCVNTVNIHMDVICHLQEREKFSLNDLLSFGFIPFVINRPSFKTEVIQPKSFLKHSIAN